MTQKYLKNKINLKTKKLLWSFQKKQKYTKFKTDDFSYARGWLKKYTNTVYFFGEAALASAFGEAFGDALASAFGEALGEALASAGIVKKKSAKTETIDWNELNKIIGMWWRLRTTGQYSIFRLKIFNL